VKGARVGIVGITFDEDVPDLRNMDVDGWQTLNQELADKPIDLPPNPVSFSYGDHAIKFQHRLRPPGPAPERQMCREQTRTEQRRERGLWDCRNRDQVSD
jgi:hypothetical protein